MSPTETESIEQTRQTEQVEQTALKKLHWRSALHTVLRLRRSGGLIDHDILAALQISLNPPSPASSIVSPTTLRRIEKYMSWKRTRNYWRNAGKHIKKQRGRRFIVGGIYCEMLIDQYEEMTTRYQMNGAYDIFRPYSLHSPPIPRHGRNRYIYVETVFTIQYGRKLPYRTCGIVLTRHPGESTLSSTELIALLLLAIECHDIAPDEPFYTTRVFACDAYTIRRLTATVPSSYIGALLQLTNKLAPRNLIDHVTIEQTPYYNFREPAGVESILTAMFEDDDKQDSDPDPESSDDQYWL